MLRAVTTLAGAGWGYADGTGTGARFHYPKGITISKSTFATEPLYTVGAFAVLIILAFLYAFFWG